MTQSVFASHRRRWVGLLLLVGSLFAGGPTAATADDGQGRLTTRYFTILYPTGEEKTAQWYAGFADEVSSSVSELLGADPVSGLTLHIYNTEAEYTQANPQAEIHPGIMAHAIPQRKEIGVAVERLRDQPPEIARESFRHEMTHIVAGVLSSYNLPIGFDEGLAQYNESSTTRAQGTAEVLRAAEQSGQPLLSWTALNTRGQFSRRMDLAYPEAYTVVAFLAERYGMGDFGRFVDDLRQGTDYAVALQLAFDQPIDVLEAQWREYLPGFLKDGWQVNVLSDYDLTPAVDLYNAGRFAEARDRFARAEALYQDLGRTTRQNEAAQYRTKAEQALAATAQVDQARAALEAHDYAAARQAAEAARRTFADLGLADAGQRAAATADLAGRGLDALAALANARAALDGFDLPQAERQARQAGDAFAALGDTAQVAAAAQILAESGQRRQELGLLALGGGLLTVLGGLVAAWGLVRRARRVPAAPQLAEENASWL
jgi:hypothetical protein